MTWPARVVLASLLLLAAFGGTASAKDKITLCHRVGGPNYVVITIAPEAVLAGHVRNHPLDIIPAFTYVKRGVTMRFPGQNLTEEGLAILGNQCVPPAPPGDETPEVPTMPENGGAITLCHALGDGTYREETLDAGAVISDHGDDDDDIIPSFVQGDGKVFPGRNLGEDEAMILADGCRTAPEEVAPAPGAPLLQVTKAATDVNGAPLVAGDVITFTITVANAGKGSAHEVAIVDAVPAGTEYVEGSATAVEGVVDEEDGYLVAYVGSGADETTGGALGAGVTATVTFSVTVLPDLPEGAVVLNLAHATGVDPSTKDPLDAESDLIELPVDVPPVIPAVIEVDPPAQPPVPGGDVVVDVTTDPRKDVEDVRVCVSLEVPPTVAGTGRYPLGYAQEKCAKPVDADARRDVRRTVRLRVPRFAAGRCTRVTADVSAQGYSSRSKGFTMCVRALPSGSAEAVVG